MTDLVNYCVVLLVLIIQSVLSVPNNFELSDELIFAHIVCTIVFIWKNLNCQKQQDFALIFHVSEFNSFFAMEIATLFQHQNIQMTHGKTARIGRVDSDS